MFSFLKRRLFAITIIVNAPTFQALGGVGSAQGAGGGGRIALQYMDTTWWFGNLWTYGGSGTNGPGGSGTLYMQAGR